jgi:hypothetical protein
MIDTSEQASERTGMAGHRRRAFSRSFIEDVQCVQFFLPVAARTVRCYVTSKVLASCFGADDEADDAELASVMLEAFDANERAIEQLARRLLDEADRADSPAIVITTSDVFHDMVCGHLSRPMALAMR